MAIITLSEARLHLRAATYVDSPDPEDTIISVYISAAEDYITRYLDREILPVNGSIKAAALLIVGDLYENREGAGEVEIKENPAVKRLLFPYRRNIGI